MWLSVRVGAAGHWEGWNLAVGGLFLSCHCSVNWGFGCLRLGLGSILGLVL